MCVCVGGWGGGGFEGQSGGWEGVIVFMLRVSDQNGVSLRGQPAIAATRYSLNPLLPQPILT